jgi:hypothetical protein
MILLIHVPAFGDSSPYCLYERLRNISTTLQEVSRDIRKSKSVLYPSQGTASAFLQFAFEAIVLINQDQPTAVEEAQIGGRPSIRYPRHAAGRNLRVVFSSSNDMANSVNEIEPTIR